MTELLSVHDIKSRATSDSQRILLDVLFATDDSSLVGLVDRAIDHASAQMALNPELKKGWSEDELTLELVSALNYMGFNAHHETKIGGHCDIVVRGPMNFLWLAEAKKFDSDYQWLIDGFNQLCTRYSTGGVNQCHGGLIIYVYIPRTDRVLIRWADRLRKDIEDIAVDHTQATTGRITSVHPHQRTGANFHVRHVAISLLWKPA